MTGYILLHREIKNHWVWSDPEKFKFWCTLLFLANYQDNKVVFGNQIIEIKRGSFITSIQNLSKITLKSNDTIRRWINLMQKDGMIELKATNKYTYITICNYDSYQDLHQTKAKTNAKQTPNKPYTTKEGIKESIIKEKEISDDFKNIFIKWLEYKFDRKESYVSKESLMQCYFSLLKLSDNNSTIAEEIVNQSMAMNWAGLFELKGGFAKKQPKFVM